MRGANLLLPFGYKYKIHRKFLARVANRMQRGEKRRLGPLLIHGATAHQDFSESRLIHERRYERR